MSPTLCHALLAVAAYGAASLAFGVLLGRWLRDGPDEPRVQFRDRDGFLCETIEPPQPERSHAPSPRRRPR